MTGKPVLLATAERTFGQCCKEVFEHCDSQIEEFLLYFHVLCLAYPGYRNPANVRLYLDYNRFFDALPMERYDEDLDLAWQYREVRWRRAMLHEQHTDLSLLSGFSFVDKDACEVFRLQCYKWMLDLDPEDNNSVQVQNWAFASECVHRLYTWISSQYANNITLAPEAEAAALLTICCSMNTDSYGHHLFAHIGEKAYDLLDRLSASKLRTHLVAHVAMRNDRTGMRISNFSSSLMAA